jgi:hypothetical protein
LSVAEVAMLTEAGVTNSEELMGLTHDDVREALPNGSLVKRRKLSAVATYLASGQNVVANTTTMADIFRHLSDRANPQLIQLPPHPPAEPDPTRGAPRMSINGLDEFDGNHHDWLDWEMSTEATVGQSAYAEFLTNPPDPNDQAKKTRNKEFFNMLAKATNQGSGTHLVARNKDNGHKAWLEIKKWYNGTAMSRQIIGHYRTKLQKLELNQNVTASSFINDFIICNDRLDAKNEGVSAESKRETFLDKITDEDFEITTQFIRLDPAITFDDCVLKVRKREQELEIQDKSSKKKSTSNHRGLRLRRNLQQQSAPN